LSAQEVAAGQSSRVAIWNRSLGELRPRDGSVGFCDGADDGALRIQGKNLRGAWLDEVGLWRQYERAFDESIGFALRKGAARLVVTGTPKADMPARALVRRLLEDPAVVKRRLRTLDNAANLSPAFLKAAKLRAGTRLGRQELEGELLEDVERALFKRAWIDDNRVADFNRDHIQRTVVAPDPADGIEEGAEQALCAAAATLDHQLYVLRSEGTRKTPLEWLRGAVQLGRELGAVIVVEKDHGGQFLVGLLEQAMRELGVRVPYRVIDGHQGKRTRAEPGGRAVRDGQGPARGRVPRA
jgi:phage terminase large subunit-like protein